jgi:alkylation response protein AidB-like acyl-CoA dehydrogenase
MVDLIASPEQREIADSVATFMRDELPLSRLRPSGKTARERDPAAWRRIAELGWFGIALGEAQGGAGYSVTEEMLVAAELGRGLASPSLIAAIIGARIAAEGGDAKLAAEIVGGTRTVACATATGAATLGATCDGEFYLVDAAGADFIVAWDDGGAALLPRTAFSAVTTAISMDEAVTLEHGTLAKARAAIWLPVAKVAVPRRMRLLLAAQLVGIAEATRDMAAAYAKIREQFGQPIGAFQAIKHMCADNAARAEAARSQVTFAALSEQEGRADVDFQLSAALVVALDAGFKNARANIQIHGGIGFTYECDANLFLKRTHLLNVLLGGQRRY